MPSQRSLRDQLCELYALANKNGLYDAADFVRSHVQSIDQKSVEIPVGTPVKMSEGLKHMLRANKCSQHVRELGDRVGTVLGETKYPGQSGPEVDVQFNVNGVLLTYSYHPDLLVKV